MIMFKDMYTTKMSSGKSLKERFEKIKLGKSSKMTAIVSSAVLIAGIIGVVIFASFVDGKDERVVMYPADGEEFEMQYPGGAMARENGWIDFDFLLDNKGGIHIAEHFICDDISNVKSGNNHTEKIEFRKLEDGSGIYKLTERYTSPAAASADEAFSVDIDMYFIPYPDAENEYLVLSVEKGAFEENVVKSMTESILFKENISHLHGDDGSNEDSTESVDNKGAKAAVGTKAPDASSLYDSEGGDADMIESGIYDFMASNFKKLSYVVKEAKVDSEKGTARIYIEIQHSDDESNDYLTILLEKREGEWSIQDYWLEK